MSDEASVPKLNMNEVRKQADALVTLVQDQQREVFKLASDKAKVEQELKDQNALKKEIRTLEDRIYAVRELHNADVPGCGDGCCVEDGDTCHHCGQAYPCATIRALGQNDE